MKLGASHACRSALRPVWHAHTLLLGRPLGSAGFVTRLLTTGFAFEASESVAAHAGARSHIASVSCGSARLRGRR